MPTTAPAAGSWAEVALHLPQYGYLAGGGGGPASPSTGATPAGTLAGAAPGGGAGAYGAVPTVPSPVTTASQAVSGNIGNLGQIYQLAGGINQFQNAQAALGLQANLPGYQQMIDTSSQNILQKLAGQVPSDVIGQLLQRGAERGIIGGQPLGQSPASNAAYLAALGKTSLGLQSEAENELARAVGRTPMAQPFNLSSMLVTPGQLQEAQTAANIYAAAPSPAAAAAAKEAAALRGLATGQGSVPAAPRLTMPSNWEDLFKQAGSGQTMFVGGALGAQAAPENFTTEDWLKSIGWTGGGPTSEAVGPEWLPFESDYQLFMDEGAPQTATAPSGAVDEYGYPVDEEGYFGY